MVRSHRLTEEIEAEAKRQGFSSVTVSGGRTGNEYEVLIHSEEKGLAKEALWMVGRMLEDKANAEVEHVSTNGSEVVKMYFKPEVARRKDGFGVWYTWEDAHNVVRLAKRRCNQKPTNRKR
jgi:hypothetical protein